MFSRLLHRILIGFKFLHAFSLINRIPAIFRLPAICYTFPLSHCVVKSLILFIGSISRISIYISFIERNYVSLLKKTKTFFIKYNVKDSRLWKVSVLFFSVFNYSLVVVSRTRYWFNALVVLAVWILIMAYFSDISKTLSATPCLLVIWRLIIINLSILNRVRVNWCSHHLYWLWESIGEVGHVFLKYFHRTAKLLM